MKRTSVFSLLTLIVIGLIGGWYFFKATENQGNSVPELPWSTAPLLIAFAGLIFILARYISAKFSERDQDRKPLPVKRPALLQALFLGRLVVLAKATSAGAAILTGIYGGFSLFHLTALEIEYARQQTLVSVVDLISSLLMLSSSLYLERVLTLPPENLDVI
jgi:hypothetical protein